MIDQEDRFLRRPELHLYSADLSKKSMATHPGYWKTLIHKISSEKEKKKKC